MLTTVAGLPAHPLLVHFAVVFTPVAALLLAVSALWPRARRWLGLATPAVALLAVLACVLAKESGERFEKRILSAFPVGSPGFAKQHEQIEHHAHQATATLIWAIVVFVLALALWLVSSGWARTQLHVPAVVGGRWPAVALGVLSLVAAVFAIWGIIATGHTGAAMAWSS
ncbi:hypothetical protein [Tsukamurella soli]|uniref:DUF2231 domain-containing protein n=1 Tax=Tsukamurella soli TaxID=644556 RepID=A0ABP8J3Q9_9ACTN